MSDFDFSELKPPLASSELHKMAGDDLDFSELGQPPAEEPAKETPKEEPKPEPKKEEPKKDEPKEDHEKKPERKDMPSPKDLMADPARFFDITYDEDFRAKLDSVKDKAGWKLYGGNISFKPASKPGNRWTIEISSPGGREIVGKIEPATFESVVAEANGYYNNELDGQRILSKVVSSVVATLAEKIKGTGYRFREINFKGLPVAIPKADKKKPGEPRQKKEIEPSIEERLDSFFAAIPKEDFKRMEKWPHFMIATLAPDKYAPINDIVAKIKSGSLPSYNWYLKKDDTLSVEDKMLSLKEKFKESSLKTASEVQWAGPALDQIAALVGAPAAAWASELVGALAAKFNYEWPTFPPIGLKKK